MDQELHNKILEYLNSSEVQEKLDSILDKHLNSGQKDNFLKIWQSIKDLEFNINDLYSFLLFIFNNDFEKVNTLDNELFEEIIISAYDELQELYQSKNQTPAESQRSAPASQSDSTAQEKLISAYQEFSNSSLFQNITAKQEEYAQKITAENLTQNMELKNDFYSAINGGDKITAVAILRLVCQLGKLQEFFVNDQRFIDFWGGYLERHKGAQIKQEFIKNPIQKKYLIEFLRFVFERRLSLSASDSAILGTGLTSLCTAANQTEYSDMAYGDEVSGEFKWGE